MDLDAFVSSRTPEWARLRDLTRKARRPRKMSGEELDELVLLYQRAATDLSLVRSATPDPTLIGRLSALVAEGRASVTGASGGAWDSFRYLLTVRFPAEVYRLWRWWLSAAVVFLGIAVALAWWIATHRHVQAALLPPSRVKELVQHDFKNYYSDHPGRDFALHVWINNAWVAALSLITGVLLGIPTVFLMYGNAVNLGVSAGYMIAAGRGAEFFGLILPHGMLELTALFIAAGVGLKLGWTVVDPGPRSRADALAEEGRSAASVSLGLILVLCVSGVLEGFVTPSPLPTAARVAIGVLVWAAFLGYIVVYGRRAVQAGELGDVELHLRSQLAPTAG